MSVEILIETTFPMPPGRFRDEGGEMGAMRKALSTMKVGESFYWSKGNNHPYLAAKQIGAKITCRKQDKGGWRIWLREGPSATKEHLK